METAISEKITLKGVVQGVGLRPFVCQQAAALGLTGHVCNTGTGLEIKVCGGAAGVDALLECLQQDLPSPARITHVERVVLAGWSCPEGFHIVDSIAGDIDTTLPADRATCTDCLRELFDSENRRYRHAFISCNRCGPRHSILRELPWDRCRTTQADFAVCDTCAREVADPRERRFHSQTNSCHDCGPQVQLVLPPAAAVLHTEAALECAVQRLREGALLAVKGPGGYQLLTRADRRRGIQRLRLLKQRQRKPLAVMFADLAQLEDYCDISDGERSLLLSAAAPIVLVKLGVAAQLDAGVAPGLDRLGAMLPATPLQHLLLREVGLPLVVSSANRQGEPLCYRDEEVAALFGTGVDGIVSHDRDIRHPLDDSIVQMAAQRAMVLRRARGFEPDIAQLDLALPPALASGADLKNCPAVSLGARLLCAAHVGSLDTLAGESRYRARVADLCDLYGLRPESVVSDMHPDYHSRRLALAAGLDSSELQHHRAHLYAALAENPCAGRPLLAVIWDGTGYGDDGTVQGGEFFLLDDSGDSRVASLKSFLLPGAEQAVIEPRRVALSLLHELGETALPADGVLQQFTQQERSVLLAMLEAEVNCPRCSSIGRLFDGVAALLFSHPRNDYEGEAAMLLEQLAARCENTDALTPWPVPLVRSTAPWQLDWRPALRSLLEQRATVAPAVLAARFHVTLAHAILAMARETGCRQILLGGGCFQNRLLLELTHTLCLREGIDLYWPRLLPPGDGGIAIGQLYALLTGAIDN